MGSLQPWFCRTAVAAVLAGSAALIGTAQAQQTTEPPGFDPYSAPYRSFAFPGAGNNPSLPNAVRYGNGLSGVNQFQRYLENGDPADPGDLFAPPTRGGRGGRYDAAFQTQDRGPVTNGDADEKYYRDRLDLERKLEEARKETDPKKRDELIRKLEVEARAKNRDVSLSVRRPLTGSTRSIPPAPALPGSTSRASTWTGRRTGNLPSRASQARANTTAPRAPALPSADSTKPARSTTPAGRGGAIPPPPTLPTTRSRTGTSTPERTLQRSREFDQRRASSAAPTSGGSAIPPAPPR